MFIFYQNVNGLCTKTEEFRKKLAKTSYDIVLLTETRLNEDITQSHLFPSSYKVYRREREDREGGGVLIAVNEERNFTKRRWDSGEWEDLWISVEYRNYTIHICCVYLVPGCSADIFRSFIESVKKRMKDNENHRFLIVGDFNLKDFADRKDSAREGSKLKALQDFVKEYDMRQYNRGRNSNDYTLDLVLCSHKISVTKVRGLVTEDDHHPAFQIDL